MGSQLNTTQSVKQSTRHFMSVASDKMKLASSAVARGDTRELDVAVIKATTSQFHVIPKEKHVRTLKEIVLAGSREHVKEVIKELLQRLKSATDWLTALKSLMVYHRLMRECNAVFLNGMVQYYNDQASSGKGLLNMGNFLDTTNIDGRFDYSEWVRGYGRYLDEQLEVYKELTFYPEMEHSGDSSRMRTLSGEQLLKQLPVLQRLQQRLMDCKPSGAASHDPVVQAALMAVLKESFKVYKAISEGIINLADRFFEMDHLDAQKGLDIYKESIVDNNKLQEYYKDVEQIDELKRAVQFPKLENLPPDFLTQMEEYVKEAPRPLEQAAAAPKKKGGPLRRGTKAAVGSRSSRLDAVVSDYVPTDPGMIGTVSQASEVLPQKAAEEEPNLLDLSIEEPTAVANGSSQHPPASETEGFGLAADFPTPSNDPFMPAVISASSAVGPAASLAQDPFSSRPSTNTGGNNPFESSTSFAPQQPVRSQPFPAAASKASAVYSPPSSAPLAGHPTAPLSTFPGSQIVSVFQQPGMGSQQSSFEAPSSALPYLAYPQPAISPNFSGPGSTSSISQPGSYGFQGSQSSFEALAGFGRQPTAAAGPSAGLHETSPSSRLSVPQQPASQKIVAAGLTRPTNLALAKEAALHDPFAGLSSLMPASAPKYSPPLKAASSAAIPSAGLTSKATSPGLQQGYPQLPSGQPMTNGFQGLQSFSMEGPAFVPSPSSSTPANPRNTSHPSTNNHSATLFSNDNSSSLI